MIFQAPGLNWQVVDGIQLEDQLYILLDQVLWDSWSISLT